MKNTLSMLLAVTLFAVLGCARVNVAGGKEPIKVDVSMRVDIYQHVERDIDNIEDIVNGQANKTKAQPGNQSMLGWFISPAYAQDGMGQDVEEAARRRGARKAFLEQWMVRGVVGEDRIGLVDIRSLENATPEVDSAVKAENSDRMVIYRAIAAKNGTTLEEVQRIYAKKLQDTCPAGTPVQSADNTWTVKK